MSMEYFRNKVCIITGAASGIGFELAKRILNAGGIVYISGRTQKSLDIARSLIGDNDNARYFAADVTRPEQVQALVKTALDEQGRIDMMFSNAGIGVGGITAAFTLEQWREVIEINLMGVIHCVHAVIPVMIKQGFGHIINTASIAGLIPCPYQAAYCASKYAVVGLSESIRLELAPQGIDVSCICPANVATSIFDKAGVETPNDAIPVDYAADWILERVAQKKTIIPVAEIAEWLYNYSMQDRENFNREVLIPMEIDRRTNMDKYIKDKLKFTTR